MVKLKLSALMLPQGNHTHVFTHVEVTDVLSLLQSVHELLIDDALTRKALTF